MTSLNDQFALAGHLSFSNGPGNLPMADINNPHATARISLHGGHVLHYQPRGHKPVLWLSEQAVYRPGQAIRGGIPVIWPWFGPHPSDPDKPTHGFARTAQWSVLETAVVADEATQMRLGFSDTDETRALWPYPFWLEILVTVGPSLNVLLTARNPGPETFTCGGALHSYFSLSHIDDITIYGLEGCTYLDKVQAGMSKIQPGPITIEAETDRIYLDSVATCRLEDPGWQRQIHVAKTGSHSTVVWNPWIDKARRMADFGDEEYQGMVCIETANAAKDVVTVLPNTAHQLQTDISVTAM